jgi:hypothetical protein
VQSKDSPTRWGCSTRGGVRPCMTGWQLAAITVGAPTVGTSVVVYPTSHHRRWSRVSFKISGGERRFLPQLANNKKSMVSGSTPRHLYYRGKLKRPFGTHVRDSAQWARHLGLFWQIGFATPRSLRVGMEPTHQQRQSTRCGKVARVASHHGHDFEKNTWPPFLNEVTPISQWHGATPRVGCK